MLTSIRLQDFKGHRDTLVPLGRFTLLVGPNGSGKTSVLDALWLQSELARPSASPPQVLRDDWAPADLLRRGAPGPIVLESAGTCLLKPWSCRREIHTNGATGLTQAEGTDGHRLAAAMGRAALYKLDAAKIAAATYSDQPGAGVEPDGTNAAVALATLKLGQDEVFERIEKDMRELVPSVERIRLRQTTVTRPRSPFNDQFQQLVGNKIFFDFRGAPGVPAHLASEGTLILLALLTILHGPNPPNVLLLDDFDQSLHPEAQVELVRLVKRLLDELPDVQIVATTRSPYILDEIDPSDVNVFALRADGTVATKRLSEHPEAGKMKGALEAGQLWSLDPERDWVLDEKAP
jgi:predicted ATPase